MSVQIQFVPSTPRDFLASLTPPLAKANSRGRFSTAGNEALAKARAEGFRFIGDEGHPQTEVKVKREKTVTTPAPAPAVSTQTIPAAAPAPSTHPAAAPASFVAKDVRSWAKANGVQVGERGRIHPSVIDAFVKAGGKPVGPRAKNVITPAVMPQRRETVGYAVERGTLFALTSCGGGQGAKKVGCGRAVSHCKCATGPVAPHYMDNGIAGTPLALVKPVV